MQNQNSPPLPQETIVDVQMTKIKQSYKDVTSNLLPSPEEPIIKEMEDIPLDWELINLSIEERNQLYDPWKLSVIIKPVRKNFAQQYLKIKLEALWRTPICLIDLRSSFYMVKFDDPENQAKALQGGPWFIARTFISVRKWELNFIPRKAYIDSMAIWLCLPHLPTEFYDSRILQRMGRRIGTLLKIDTCTSASLWGRYAKIWVQIQMDIPVMASINIGGHHQEIEYEGEGILCTAWGYLGHTSSNY